MEKNKNLEELTKEVSHLLINCIYLLEIFEEISEGERKQHFLINSLQKDIRLAFDYLEQGRLLISNPD